MPAFTMPSLGADMEAGTLVEWLVHEGDTVHRGDPMAVVDTDKSAIEVESFEDGVVDHFLVQPGTKVAVGTPMASLTPLGVGPLAPEPSAPPAAAVEPLAPAPAPEPAPEPPLPQAAPGRAAPRPTATPSRSNGGRRVSPYARKLAHELGVDLAQVPGSGEHGLVRSEDVRKASRRRPVAAVAEPRARSEQGVKPPGRTRPGKGEARTEHGARSTIAALMSRAKREIPHYYVATTVDLHALTEWLRRTNRERAVSERIVPAAAVIKAAALAAREHPELNGFWVDDRFVPGAGVHIGVAVSVRDGALVAPAIHDTDTLDLPSVMAALRDLVRRARAGRLRRAELSDPTLTVTDLGDQGVEEVIGVIYPPQVALLGVGRVTDRAWAVDGLVGVRPTLRLTLSGDHRATDGATGARFLNTVDHLLQDPEEL